MATPPSQNTSNNASNPNFMSLSDEQFLSKLQAHGKYKQRSHNTHHNIHMRELNNRLKLLLDPPPPSPPSPGNNQFASKPDFSNKSSISVVYLGHSMLERFKTTGQFTRLHKLPQSWNAGCGGDKNENVIYRLNQGLYDILLNEQRKRRENSRSKCNIKLWVLASGSNNLHRTRGLSGADVASWKMLVEACLRIAPESRVLACDVFYRKDVSDQIVELCNGLLRSVVDEVNRDLEEMEGQDGKGDGKKKVEWVEARHLITKDMLLDHAHLNEEGYRVWDEVVWPHVAQEGFADGNKG